MKRHTIATVAICSLLLIACQNKPERVVDQFYQATQNSDFEKAISFTDVSPEIKTKVIQYIEELGMVIHNYKIQGSTIQEGDTTALVDLHIVTSNAYQPDSTSSDIKVLCVKKDNTWKVHL